jgi:hypothetical protein
VEGAAGWVGVLHEPGHRRVGREATGRQQPVSDAPCRVDVGPAVDVRPTECLLGRDEGGVPVIMCSAVRAGVVPTLSRAYQPKSSTLTKSQSSP